MSLSSVGTCQSVVRSNSEELRGVYSPLFQASP